MGREMVQAKILVVGLGDLGGRIATGIHRAFPQDSLIGMRRQADGLPGVTVLQHDAAQAWPTEWADDALAELTDVVLCLSPDGRTEAAYQHAYYNVAQQAATWLTQYAPNAHVWLISSTSVYGQASGEWVDETADTHPESPTAKILIDTEQYWLNSGLPVTILRPAGIYGPGREYMFRQAREGFVPVADEPLYTNRIHIDDAARAVVHLLEWRVAGLPVADRYNLTDSDPASLQVVLAWLHKRLGVTPTEQRAMQRASKRISNARLLDTGFVLEYPSFREGYADMLNGG